MIKRLLCRLSGGHWRVLHARNVRICLKCVQCGHETPGWERAGL
jgi:hypothetical protein